MKSKIFLYLSLLAGFAFTACNDDDDFNVNTTPIVDENSVVTGSADVTATTATLHGTVAGLENSSPSSYVVGFNYGVEQDEITQTINGAFTEGTTIEAEVTGLTEGTTIYYQAFVKLQGKLTFTGEVKSFVTTSAVVTTKEAAEIGTFGATLGASVSGAPADAKFGVILSGSNDPEILREGVMIPADGGADFTVAAKGLASGTQYYYAGYADLGSGIVYGDIKPFATPVYDFDVDNDLVDLGLSVRWARFNVGAETETELGGRFGFGDPTGTLTTTILKNYASADIYKSDLDVASRSYDGKLTLPTAEQFKELFSKCTKEWTTVDGVAGCKLTGPNGNSIFLPAAGSRTVNDITGAGIEGLYATGSILSAGSKFAVAYNFSASTNGRINAPLYQALSVRAVSTAINVPFDKTKLYNTWEIDYKDGESIRFDGPVHFYGTDDSWRSITNKEPILGNSWAWEAGADQSWAFGDCTGELTLREDGTVTVKTQDGTETNGTYTIDEENKTITSTIDLLYPSAMSGYADYKTNVKILQLADDKLSIGFFRDTDPATVSVNMIPQSKKYGLSVLLNCVDSNWAGQWDAPMDVILPDNLPGEHTAVYNGASDNVMVFTLDIVGLSAKYPDALVTVTEIRCDGNPIPFDGSKFRYGDIENNGKFRVELFNVFGKASAGGVVVESPFSNGTNMGSEPAVNFTQKLEIDYMITLNNHFSTGFVAVQNDWSVSTWGDEYKTGFDVMINDGKYEVAPASLSLSVAAAYTNPIMMFLETKDFYQLFPGAKMTLTEIKTDGTALTGWNADKVVNTSADGDGIHHRLELFNCWGETANNCAFGVKDGDVMHELGFSNSVDLSWNVESLFAAPQF